MRHFLGGDLDARELLMEPYAKLAEPKFAQNGLAALHEAQRLDGHRRPIGDARRQACRSGAVPRRKPRKPGKLANLLLAQSSVQERGEHAMLRRSPVSRAEIVSVVGADCVSYRREPARGRQFVEAREQLRLAVVAAVGIVGYIKRIVELLCLDEFVKHAGPADERFGLRPVVGRKTRG